MKITSLKVSFPSLIRILLLATALIIGFALVFILPHSLQTSMLVVLISLLTALISIIVVRSDSFALILKSIFSPYKIDSDGATASSFLFDQLKEMQCNPHYDKQDIIFHYQSGNFKAMWLDRKVIRIAYPCIYAAPNSLASRLYRIANTINSDYMLVKIMVIPRSDKSEMLVHAVADIFYTSVNKDTSILLEVLAVCFEIQRDFLREADSVPILHSPSVVADIGDNSNSFVSSSHFSLKDFPLN